MLQKVLVPTDFSAYADAVLHCVGGIPGIEEVVLLHVATPSPAEREKPRDRLARIETMLRKRDLSVSSIVLTTPAQGVADTIIRVAEEEGVDLILIGARGRGIIRSALLGSVSSDVVRRAHTSVLIMRHRVLETLEGLRYEKFCPRIFGNILIPVDLSRESRQSLAFLGTLSQGGSVILAHVVTHGEAPAIVQAYVEDAELALDGIKNDLLSPNTRVTTVVRVGNPAHEIARLAEEEDVSLILVASSHKGGLERFLMGSTAYAITDLARRPVLVVKVVPEA
jgi:nucleotide-binding universal stress UspA family protein